MRDNRPLSFLATATIILGSLWNAAFAQAQETGPEPEKIKEAVTKALPLLQKGAAGHVESRSCFACHSQALPVLAFSMAKQHGFKVDDDVFKEQLKHTHGVIADWAKRNPDRKRFGGGETDTAVHTLLTLELGGWKADKTTAAVVEYLILRDKNLGHWRSLGNRPPTQGSSFSTTALALRGMRAFGTDEQKKRIDERVEAARAWLVKTPAKDHEDRVYRLWGLKFADAKAEDIQSAVRALLDNQGKDGGWAQTAKLTSDAYATGSALTALHLAGDLAVDDEVYQRGLEFLLKDQKADGTWHVRTRSKPIQSYFETGFPHGKDQWISTAASSWATAALVLATPMDVKK
jgi:hypothetical protein